MSEYLVAPSIEKPKYLIPLNKGYLFTNSLSLYNPLTLKRKLQLNSLRMVNCLKGLKLFFRNRIVPEPKIPMIIQGFDRMRSQIRRAFGPSELYCSFLISNSRKTIIQVMDKNTNILGYVKVVTGASSKKDIDNEYKVLKFLNQCNLKHFCVPQATLHEVTNDYRFLVLAPYRIPVWQSNLRLTRAHIDALVEMFSVDSVRSSFTQSSYYKIMKGRINDDTRIGGKFKEIFCRVVRGISGFDLPFGLCHYDFKPWNVRKLYNNKLYIFDWELARFNWLPLWDFFHYILQPAILVKKHGPTTLTKMLRKKQSLAAAYLEALDIPRTSYSMLMYLYLLDVLTHYRKKMTLFTDKQTSEYAHSIEELLKSVVYEN